MNTESTLPVSTSMHVLLKDGFEADDFSKWSLRWTVQDVSINADPSHVRSGAHSAQIHYFICSTCGDEHQDAGRFVLASFNSTNGYPNGLHHVLVRGSVYFKTPEPGGSVEIQRKLFYLLSPGLPDRYWAVVLTSDGVSGSPNKIRPYLVLGNSTLGGDVTRLWTASDAQLLGFDGWHDVQVEVRTNTLGLSDGRVALWLDGIKVYENNSLNIRLDADLGLDSIYIGHQADRLNYLPVDEYRYWDDIEISEGATP